METPGATALAVLVRHALLDVKLLDVCGLLLRLLAYTGYKGYWEVFVSVLAVTVITARRDMILGFRPSSQDRH